MSDSELEVLFNKYGCDKSDKHQYHDIYEQFMYRKKDDRLNILEIGVWKGASTMAFHDYFQNSHIYGIDVFERLSVDDVEANEYDRVYLAKGNSMEASILSLLHNDFSVEYDFIIDDGAHYPKANRLTFKYAMNFLKVGGTYFIEDVFPFEKLTLAQRAHPWLQKYPDRYNDIENEAFLKEIESSGFKIERFDNRKLTGQPDSYIIALTRKY